MNVESAALVVLVFGILGTQMARFKLFTVARRDIEKSITELEREAYLINSNITEVCKVGADIADGIEAMVDGGGVASAPEYPHPSGKVDIPATIIHLMANKLMSGLDGSKTQPLGAIHQHDTQTPQDDYIDIPTAPQDETEL